MKLAATSQYLLKKCSIHSRKHSYFGHNSSYESLQQMRLAGTVKGKLTRSSTRSRCTDNIMDVYGNTSNAGKQKRTLCNHLMGKEGT